MTFSRPDQGPQRNRL